MKSDRRRGALPLAIVGGRRHGWREVSDATVAFLMPDQASTRYEEHDFPASSPKWQSFARPAR